MKYSRKREMVLEAVRQSALHPTADMVYRQVRKQDPSISLATVYRNLNQLVENHVIRRIAVPGDSDHFDYSMMYHEHMVCTKCGRVVDVWPEQPLTEKLRELSDAAVTGYDLVLYGVCRACMEQEVQTDRA